MKKVIVFASLILLAAISAKSQPTSVISFGPAVTILNTTSTGAVTGTTYALPGGTANAFTWQVIPVGGPSALSVNLQVSLDGTNWQTLTNCATSTGCIYNAGVNAYVFVRANAVSRTGGTATTAVLNTDRAYGTARGSNPVIAGHLLFSPDNTYDIGASGANRPRALYTGANIDAGTSVQSAGNSILGWSGRARMFSPADSQIRLSNAAGTDFARLQFGGTANTFPALKRNSAEISVVLADDSAASGISASYFRGAAVTFAGLAPTTNGTMIYCSDCNIANPCTAAGSGAIAKRLNGVWVCN